MERQLDALGLVLDAMPDKPEKPTVPPAERTFGLSEGSTCSANRAFDPAAQNESSTPAFTLAPSGSSVPPGPRTATPEAVAPRLTAFCGLDWDRACLRPE